MPTISWFPSIEEAFEAIRSGVAVLDEKIKPWQRQMVIGHHFMQVHSDHVSFGIILDCAAGERELGASEEEVEQVRQEWLATPNRRWCHSFASTYVYEDGELDAIHIALFTSWISPEKFDELKQRNWEVSKEEVLELAKGRPQNAL